jgi:hypothetical protein
MFNFGGPNFGSVQNGTCRLSPINRNRLNGDHPAGSSGESVGCQVSGTGGGYFGRFLNGRWLCGEWVVKEWIVVPIGRDLGRDGGTGHQDDDDNLWEMLQIIPSVNRSRRCDIVDYN